MRRVTCATRGARGAASTRIGARRARAPARHGPDDGRRRLDADGARPQRRHHGPLAPRPAAARSRRGARTVAGRLADELRRGIVASAILRRARARRSRSGRGGQRARARIGRPSSTRCGQHGAVLGGALRGRPPPLRAALAAVLGRAPSPPAAGDGAQRLGQLSRRRALARRAGHGARGGRDGPRDRRNDHAPRRRTARRTTTGS